MADLASNQLVKGLYQTLATLGRLLVQARDCLVAEPPDPADLRIQDWFDKQHVAALAGC